MAKKVISSKNLPMRSPLGISLLGILMLDFYQASPILWGIVCTLMVIVWIGWATTLDDISIDIFK